MELNGAEINSKCKAVSVPWFSFGLLLSCFRGKLRLSVPEKARRLRSGGPAERPLSVGEPLWAVVSGRTGDGVCASRSHVSPPLPFFFPSFALQSESSSSSNISTMLVTHDYTAVKEDEINVYQGEVVQILASNQQNMFLVFRAATDQCPAAEGWIPGFVLGHTSTVIAENPDGTLK